MTTPAVTIQRVAGAILALTIAVPMGAAIVSTSGIVLPAPSTHTVYDLVPVPGQGKAIRDALGLPDNPDFRDVDGTYLVPRAPAVSPAQPMTDQQAAGAAVPLLEAALPKSSASTYVLTRPLTLLRSEATLQAPPGVAVPESVLIAARRSVDGLPVFGTNSVAIVEVRDAHPVGALIRWRRAVPTSMTRTLSISFAGLESRLATALSLDLSSPAPPLVKVTSSPKAVYVDTGSRLEPAYRIVGTLETGTHSERFEIFTAGDPDSDLLAATSCQLADVPSALSVETYAYGGDGSAWLKNARLVDSELSSGAQLDVRRSCAIEQDYLKDEKNLHINSAEFAVVETHGLPGIVLTETGTLALSAVGGYGHLIGGALRLLLLHSCLVVESPHENCDHWQERWFSVFAGLHTVLGFHTDIEYTDGVSAAFARSLRYDTDLIRGWVLEASAHYGRTNSPLGKASAVTTCDHQRHSLAELKNETVPAPECLVIYWVQ